MFQTSYSEKSNDYFEPIDRNQFERMISESRAGTGLAKKQLRSLLNKYVRFESDRGGEHAETRAQQLQLRAVELLAD